MNNEHVDAFIPLVSQPQYGIIASILALAVISFAMMTARGKMAIVPKFLCYSVLSALGSILFAIAAIFISNSVGVYV